MSDDSDDAIGGRKVAPGRATAGAQPSHAGPSVGKVTRVQAEMGGTRAGRPGAQAASVATPAVFGLPQRHAAAGSLSLGLENEPAGESILAGPTINGAPLTQQPVANSKPSTKAAKPTDAKSSAVSRTPRANVSMGRDPQAQAMDALLGRVQSSAEALADSDIVDDVALAEANRGLAPGVQVPAVDADQVLDALASTSAVLHNMAFTLESWGYAGKLASAQHFVDDKQAWLPSADVTEFDRWAPVIVAQRRVVGRAAQGCQGTLAYLAMRGFSPTNVKHEHPAATLLAKYAEAAGTSALTQSATATLQNADATFAKLALHAVGYEAAQAGDDVAEVSATTKTNPRTAPSQLPALRGDAEYLNEKAAGLQRLDKLGVAPTLAQLQLLELQTAVLRYRSQVANLQGSLRSLNAALSDATSSVLAGVAEAFAGRSTTLLRADLWAAEQDLDVVDGQLVDALRDDAKLASAVPTGALAWFAEKQLESKQARIAAAQTRFVAVVAARHLDGGLFKRAEQGLKDAVLRTLVAHVAVMIAVAVATGGIGAIAGETMGSAVLTAGAATTLEGAATLATAARYARVATSLGVDALGFSAVQTKLNGGSFGVNFLETLALNGTVMAALRPWQALTRGWLGLDEEAFAIWLVQGQTSKVLATRGAVASVEIFTAMAIANIGQRVLAVAHGREPDEATLLQFTLDGAAMAMGHMINMQLEGQLARFKNAGAHAGELLGRMVRQRAAAKALAATEAGGRTAAMDLVIEQRAILIEEVALWRGLAQDPTALKATELNADQASAKLASVDAQLGATTTIATTRLTLQMNNITEEVAGGRLWAGSANDINAALSHARKLGFSVEILDAHDPVPANSSRGDVASDVQASAPVADTSARGTRIVKVAINGETFEIRERVARADHAGDVTDYEFNDLNPGPLGDRKKYDPQNKKWALPIEGFKGGHYDTLTLETDKIFYRVGDATAPWGQWWTDAPLQSEAQYRLDVAVKREWSNAATGEIESGKTKSQEEKVLWCYAAKIPRGTTVYLGPVGSQGGVFMGGSATLQYFIPKAWQLEGQGGAIVSKEVFVQHKRKP